MNGACRQTVSRPTISVAIATYNRARMVAEAIEAALGQTFEPDEIVVSDDASSDETAAALERIAARESRVRVIRQELNSGGVGNWNQAMRATRGELIAWCSDDDRFTAEHLKESVEFLSAHPEVAMVHSSFIDAVEGNAVECGVVDCGGGGQARMMARRLRSKSPIEVTERI